MMRERWNITRMVAVAILLVAGAAMDRARAEESGAKGKSVATPPAADGHNPFAAAIAAAQARTVKLLGAGAGREHGYASGILVSPDGHILTALGIYVTGDLNSQIQIVLPDGAVYNAAIERRSEAMQVALLKIDAKTPQFFELADKPVVLKGDWVMSVANPFKVADRDEPMSVNMGIVSLRTAVDAKKRAQDVDLEGEVLLIDAITSNPGAGGGALMTADGKLAGMVGKIVESKSTNTRLNYAIPSDRLKLFLDGKDEPKIASPPDVGEPGKADLGVRLFRLSGKRAPAYIDRVVADSPAAKAGLQKDDMILAIKGEPTRTLRDFDEQMETVRPGEEIVVIFKRKNEILSVRMTPVAVKE